MAASPQCSALAAAKDKKGLSYAQIASQLGLSEQRVIDICTGAAVPSTGEFNSLASVLDIKSPAPQDAAHVRV
ncbi:hypothetical protein IEO21_05573 [Rhodonia placenta]|uniref:HTH cro/C1-type domain-containing protein n=2 Tax=Rhodonia placenta TaxID=104341 RepID=A0A1X6N0M2_9APHY|nr:hypothetical protein POSPLADRAFT_1074394 [Postia placenta MAD-698-R-SB12]KAF9813466.1 hypothetical protein IEO21_05573 [Postia placenta]OSX62026.1 hypothetical protein POSPLADRAFT_1074394 [Postia placenta MAD-698-R-SB12]